MRRILYIALALGVLTLLAGVAVGLTTRQPLVATIAIILQTLGAAVVFPILLSFAYDRINKRWLADAVWRIFGELADAGIDHIYPDREYAPYREDAPSRQAVEFLRTHSGEVRMMGPSLRVFFRPSALAGEDKSAGPQPLLYGDMRRMLEDAAGRVRIRALIQRTDSPAIRDRIAVEETDLPPGTQSRQERDIGHTIKEIQNLNASLGDLIELRQFMPAPYCTAVIFPHLAFMSPNLLSPDVPVRLPMIAYRADSHGYRVIAASFEYLWSHRETLGVAHPSQSP